MPTSIATIIVEEGPVVVFLGRLHGGTPEADTPLCIAAFGRVYSQARAWSWSPRATFARCSYLWGLVVSIAHRRGSALTFLTIDGSASLVRDKIVDFLAASSRVLGRTVGARERPRTSYRRPAQLQARTCSPPLNLHQSAVGYSSTCIDMAWGSVSAGAAGSHSDQRTQHSPGPSRARTLDAEERLNADEAPKRDPRVRGKTI
ncbi:hypothetical protein EIP86_011313 [Pleurotus ostreatoroseus]|nr:hypothetical protein EIP86_011313 [Pleurotus ostreatoroseus]